MLAVYMGTHITYWAVTRTSILCEEFETVQLVLGN